MEFQIHFYKIVWKSAKIMGKGGGGGTFQRSAIDMKKKYGIPMSSIPFWASWWTRKYGILLAIGGGKVWNSNVLYRGVIIFWNIPLGLQMVQKAIKLVTKCSKYRFGAYDATSALVILKGYFITDTLIFTATAKLAKKQTPVNEITSFIAVDNLRRV